MHFKLGKRADYAVRAMLVLAQPRPGLRKAREIAEQMAIPETYVPQILADLVRANLATSQAGPDGGYALARPAETISLLDAVEAVEPDVRSTECILRGGPCRWEDRCAVHEPWARGQEALLHELTEASFGELARTDAMLTAADADTRAGAVETGE